METVALSQRKEADALSWEYRYFGSALLGCAAEKLPLAVRAILTWAESESRRSIRNGRAPDASQKGELTLGLRLAYNALKAEAAILRGPSLDAPPGEPVLHAVAHLRHRQRAILILRYGLDLDEAETARVTGIRRSETGPITACGVSRLAKHLRRPMDLPREFQKAGRSMKRSCVEGPAEESAVVTPIHRRASVVERLIASPGTQAATAPAADEHARDRSAMHAPNPSVGNRARNRSLRGWSFVGRLAAVFGIGALFAWAVSPVYG